MKDSKQLATQIQPKEGIRERTIDEKTTILRSRYEGRDDAFNIDRTPYEKLSTDPSVKIKKKQFLNCDNITDKRIPLSEEAIKRHITGEAPIAIFQKLLDNTIKFAVVDFDHPWEYGHVAGVQAFVWNSCGVPCYLAKSSRKGWHLTFYFKTWTDLKFFTSFWSYVVQKTIIDKMVTSGEPSSDGRFFSYPEVFPRPSSYGDEDPLSLSCGAIKLPMVEPRMRDGFNALYEELEEDPICIPDQWGYLERSEQIEEEWFKAKLVELQIEVVEPNQKCIQPQGNGSSDHISP